MKVTIDTTKVAAAYTQAFQRFRALPGFSQKEVLRAEVGSILKAWCLQTKVATKEQIERRTRSGLAKHLGMDKADNNGARITVNNGARGGMLGTVWLKTRGGFDTSTKAARKAKGLSQNGAWKQFGVVGENGVFGNSWMHFKATEFNIANMAARRYADMLRKRRVLAQRSSGLNRQSIVQIADALGIDLIAVKGGKDATQAVAKARAAMASNGSVYQNGNGVEQGDETRNYISIFNGLPYNVKTGMATSLAYIIAGRAGMIEKSYAKGVFDSAKGVARQFPNLVRVAAPLSA